MAYNAYETQQALEPPAITVDRVDTHLFRTFGRLAVWVRRQLDRIPGVDLEVETRTYTGRLLSQQEMQPFVGRLEALEEMAPSEVGEQEEMLEVIRDFLIAMHIPPSVVLELPPLLMQEAVEDFFGCQLRASQARGKGAGTGRPSRPPGRASRSGSKRTKTTANPSPTP